MTTSASYRPLSVHAATAGLIYTLSAATAGSAPGPTPPLVPLSPVKWEHLHGSGGQIALPFVGTYLVEGNSCLGDEARSAVGNDGMARLESFRRLRFDWDRQGASPLDDSSARALSEFFRVTKLTPKRLGLFMSPCGQLITNWEDVDGNLVELEFLSGRVMYFIERTGEEGQVTRDDIGISSLLTRLNGNLPT